MSAFSKASYSGGAKSGGYDDADTATHSERLGEERSAIPLPRKFSLIERGDLTREDDVSGLNVNVALFLRYKCIYAF